MTYLLDTSALVKRYLAEAGSARVRRLFQTAGAIFYQTFLTPLETTSALYRRHRAGQISAEELSILLKSYAIHSHEEYFLISYSESLMDRAGTLIARHPLRALDAIQHASALKLRDSLPAGVPSLIFLSADDALVTAARQEHLQAENPERAS
ncbi:MAG: type II toxin-antitoxin system VapC family toxin [Candidatus Binatia bacterium]